MMLRLATTIALLAAGAAAFGGVRPGAMRRTTAVRMAAVPPAVPPSRREMIQRAALSIAGVLAAQQLSPAMPQAFAAEGIDYKAVAADIADVIKVDINRAPTLVRLAWHSSGTYSKKDKDGGSYEGTMRFAAEQAHGANAGLDQAVNWMAPIIKKYPGISHGDLYTLAGVVAVKACGGPVIPWKSGRVDAAEETMAPDGRLPAADKGSPEATAAGLRGDVFYRMGFNDKDIVALSGAHALGRCHPDASGYDGPWTPTPTTLNNAYFSLLLNVPWTPKKWDGPFQYEDPSGKLMMLPSDIVVRDDPKFAKYAKMYAKDGKLWEKDFTAAFNKLLELGCSGLTAQEWA